MHSKMNGSQCQFSRGEETDCNAKDWGLRAKYVYLKYQFIRILIIIILREKVQLLYCLNDTRGFWVVS